MSKPPATRATTESPPPGAGETPAKGRRRGVTGAGAGERSGAATAKKKPGPPKPDPTRYGDWEKNGRCIDF